jgi:hypothetical protein
VTTALPTQVTYGTFKGKLIDAINTGAGEVSSAVTGTVTASPAVKSVNIPAALTVMLPRPVTVTLDATGAFTMQLVATDDPALSVLNWAYQISFQLNNGDALAPFLVQIPGGSTVDLSTANPVSTGGGVAITQGNPGPAGPTALFDADAVPYLNATAPAPTGPGVQPAGKRLVTEASALLTNNAGAPTFTISGVNPAIIMKASASLAWTVQSAGINNLTFSDKSSRGHIILTYGATAAAAITHMASTLEIEAQLKVGVYGPVLDNRQISDTVASGVINFGLKNWPMANPGQPATSVSFETSGGVKIGAATIYTGVGVPGFSPNADGDIYLRTDGGAGTTLYQRRTGAWVATAA